MKCKSCDADINPQWKHAIDSNICPFCGKNVMEELLKNLFASLREIMSNIAEYPNELNDWMLSNYNFIKTDSPELINYLPMDQLDDWMKLKAKSRARQEEAESKKFTVKVQTEHGEEEVVAEKTQSAETTNEFFKRAEAVKPNIDGFKSAAEKTQRLKTLAQQIKRAGAPVLTANEAGSLLSPEMMEHADPEAVAEMQSLIDGGAEIASALPSVEDDEIPNVVLAMAQKAQGKSGSASNAADLMKLQQMQDRVRNSRSNFESGENRGKGGFSRSG